MNRNMVSRGFGRGSVGRGLGRGTRYQITLYLWLAL
jgi:hypothetical protein